MAKVEKKGPRKFVPNADDAKTAADKGGSGGGAKLFRNVGDLPDNKKVYFRVLPPKDSQMEAWGGSPTVPQNQWMLKDESNDKWLTSISETSLGPDTIDSVGKFLMDNGLHKETGFKEEDGKISQKVKAYRGLMKGKYDKKNFKPIAPNRSNTFLLTVVEVEKDRDEDGSSVPVGAPCFLALNWGLNQKFNSQDLGMDPLCYDLEDGFDIYVIKNVTGAGNSAKTSYDIGIRPGKNSCGALVDGDAIWEEAPDLMAELEKGVNPKPVIKFFAEELGYELPEDEDGEEEEEENAEEEDEEEEEEEETPPTRRNTVTKKKVEKTPPFKAPTDNKKKRVVLSDED